MPTISVGLALRVDAVEVVEARKTFGGAQLLNQARVPISGQDDAQVIAAIQAAVQALQNPKAPVHVTLPEHEVLLRYFTLPHLPRSEWVTAIQFEARKYIPFKIEDVVWDFHAIGDRDAKTLSVVFAAVRFDTLTKVQGWLEAAGVRAAVIEPPWFSLARLADTSRKPSGEQFTALVDLEARGAHLAIVRDQLPYLGRDLNLGPADGSGVTAARSEKLLTELRFSFDFFAREHPSASIGRVLLFGDPETVSVWCTTLAPHLPCPVEAGLPPLRSPRGEPMDLGFSLAASTALRGWKISAPALDFARPTSVKEPARAKGPSLPIFDRLNLDPDFIQDMAKPLGLQAGLAVAGLAALMLMGHQQVAKTRQQVNAAIQAFSDVGWGLKQKSREELETLKPKIEERLAFLQKAMSGSVLISEKLTGLAGALPDGVWLEMISYHNALDSAGQGQPSLTLNGACFLPNRNELEVISQFAQRVKQDQKFLRGFGSTQLGQIAQMTDGQDQTAFRTFQLNCRAERTTF